MNDSPVASLPFSPELLAPAGNLEKCKVAVLYGADAVYLSGQRFGMRAGADNFTNADIVRAMAFVRPRKVKVYVTINTFFHDEDFDGLTEFCHFLEEQGIAGVIVSDLGAIRHIKKVSTLEVHVSTQSSCLNTHAALMWRDAGATRIVVGRELSIHEAATIKQKVGVEVEMFIHGAMCMAYSGNCVISNYTAGRDSNRGGCIQSCRFSYTQKPVKGLRVLEDKTVTSHVISSKDMQGLAQVPRFIESTIDSLKIEGRMKSPLYVATATSVYRRAIDAARAGRYTTDIQETLATELNAVPHREYFSASFDAPAPHDSTYENDFGTTESGSHRFVGMALERTSSFLALRTYTKCTANTVLEALTFTGEVVTLSPRKLYDCAGSEVAASSPGAVVCVPLDEYSSRIEPYTVLRAQ